MADDNKPIQYMRYAIGEILLVVIGILIALSINNWNASRKLEQKKQEIILNLIDDFEENIAQLKPEIEDNNELYDDMNAFIKNAYKPNVEITLDSLTTLSDSFFRGGDFFPSMATFDEAKANGNLTLLKSKDLSKQFIAFQRNYGFYSNMQEQGINSFFSGPVWELKKTIGSLSVLTRGKKDFIKVDIDAYIKLINTPLVKATLENQRAISWNTHLALSRMLVNSKKIIETLTSPK